MHLGFDIGGSSIKAALVQKNKIVGTRFERLPKNFEGLVKAIVGIKNDFTSNKALKIEGVGFSIAGPLDKKREKVLNSCNISYLNNKPFLQRFKRELSPFPVVIEHDVYCFLLAEFKVGAAKKYKNVFYLALGTGIGGAFMIDGKIIKGSHGSAGEVGRTIIDINGEKVWEDVAANKFIRKKLGLYFSEAKQRADAGNKIAAQIFGEMGKNLGIGIANIINTFDSEVIIIGGGVASAKNLLKPGIKKGIEKYVVSPEARKTKILWSKLGRFGGALGAALLFEK